MSVARASRKRRSKVLLVSTVFGPYDNNKTCVLILSAFAVTSFFFFSSRRRHTILQGDWSSDVCSSDLLNEAGNMPALLDRVQIALARVDLDYQLLIVDDDSQDATADIVNEYSRRDPRIRLLVRKGARGLDRKSVV